MVARTYTPGRFPVLDDSLNGYIAAELAKISAALGALTLNGALTAVQITNVAAGGIAATDVQAALDELDSEKAPKASPAFTGTWTAAGRLTISANASSVSPQGDALLFVANVDDSNTRLTLEAYGVGVPAFSFRRALGSNASKTALNNGSQIGIFGAAGWDGGSAFTNNVARVVFKANEAWSSGVNGSRIEFDVTVNGGTSLVTRLTLTDSLATFGCTVLTPASPTTVAGLRIPSGTAPSSPTSGDIWYDGTNLKFRDGGTTRTITWV